MRGSTRKISENQDNQMRIHTAVAARASMNGVTTGGASEDGWKCSNNHWTGLVGPVLMPGTARMIATIAGWQNAAFRSNLFVCE